MTENLLFTWKCYEMFKDILFSHIYMYENMFFLIF